MLVAPLYARHKGTSRKTDKDIWSIPLILRFCYLIRALKYIFPLCLALIGVIDFFVTWKYCELLPLFWSSVFTCGIKACFLVFLLYGVLYLIVLLCECAPIIIHSQDPKIKCLIFFMLCSIIFCISPFLLYTIFAVIFTFQTWTIGSSEYTYIKWLYVHIIQYLQQDINTISKKYFRIARDRPLRIYIIMFKALIMWLNIQIFQFLITDYPRYCNEWEGIRHKMSIEEKQRLKRKQYIATINNANTGAASTCCGGNRVCNNNNVDVQEPDLKYDIESDEEHEEKTIQEYYNSYSSLSPTHSSGSNSGGCCDFNFNKNDIYYDSLRVDRYNNWCNERYFKSLRSPLAIINEIVASYPATQIDYVNVYNLSQRHLYRYSNETFDKAQSQKHPVYAYAAIALYLFGAIHTILFFVCYHFGFKNKAQPVLGYIYLLEYIILYAIFTMMIFNVLHCDRLLTIIQYTSWFDDKLRDTIHDSLIGNGRTNNNDVDEGELIFKHLPNFYIHHKRVVQITVQHYMMLHVLNMVLQNKWLSELIIEYLYGFHAFCDGDETVNKLIKNIVHGTNHNEWGGEVVAMDDVNEWSLSKSDSENGTDKNKNLDINNLDHLAIPTDTNFLGVSNRIINKPNIDDENVVNFGGDLLNQFMEEKFVSHKRTDEYGMCICHEDDKGFARMWDELNLDVVRLQYNAFKKRKDSIDEYQNEILHEHTQITKSMEFYFDFIRSLHYDAQAEQDQNINNKNTYT